MRAPEARTAMLGASRDPAHSTTHGEPDGPRDSLLAPALASPASIPSPRIALDVPAPSPAGRKRTVTDRGFLAGRDLTVRERQVLGLAARGMLDKEIAKELLLSTATVNTHMRRILAKLRARDRGHAIAIAHAAGLLPSSATRLLARARPLLAGIPACPQHPGERQPVPGCAWCAWSADARQLLADADALLAGGGRTPPARIETSKGPNR